MKFCKASVLGLVLAPALAGCSDRLDTPAEAGGPTVITAVVENAPSASRSCVDMSDTGNGYLGLLWNPGDSIGVFGKNTTRNALFRSANQSNAAKADFAGRMDEGDTPYRAYYPYSTVNDGASVTDLAGTVPAVQTFELSSGRLTGDYKYGAPVANGSSEFSFRHLFSLLQVDIDASGTGLAGERLEYIELTAKSADGTPRAINGSFRFSAVDGSWRDLSATSPTTKMTWTDSPELTAGQSYTGFITVIPDVRQGDVLTVTVATNGHKASFTAPSKIDFEAGSAYCLPLALSRFASDPQYGWTEAPRPSLNSFSFAVANNKSKLLDNETVWNDSSRKPEFRSVSTYMAAVGAEDVTITIPYLYDFHLVPDFEVPEGCTVSVGGVTQTSGKTEVDFTNPVTYTVSNGDDSRDYIVKVENTGLPVVVIRQSTSGDFSEVKTGGFAGFGGTVVNKFVDFMVRDKATDWVTDDRMTVYNADGTVDMAEALCGVKLRGNTSKAYPKKPFAVKMVSKQAVLGMPAHKRWVLLANWLDHSMMRNTVAFDVAHAVENAWKGAGAPAGIPWNVHGRNVELVMDGHYVGNYYLCEQIKINKNRLDIQDAYEDVKNPTFETCGYLLELDNNYDETYKFKTTKGMPVMFKDDLPDTEIFNKVKAKIQGIEDNIASGNYTGAYADLDIYSVIDQWVVWELTMNREFIEPRSVYYFMDGDGKLTAGPVWDFDRGTFQNTSNAASQGSDRVKPYDSWVYQIGLTSSPKGIMSQWYQYLFKDPNFCKAVQERWAVLKPALESVVADIERHGTELALSYEYDSAMWPTDKQSIQTHKSGFKDWSGDENIADFSDVVANMVTVYRARLAGMDALITGGTFAK